MEQVCYRYFKGIEYVGIIDEMAIMLPEVVLASSKKY